MKKLLTITFALLAATCLNAQEICTFNQNNSLGLYANGTTLIAGTVIGETKSMKATIGADDTYKRLSATFTIGDQTITGGLQGTTNPKDAEESVPANSLLMPVRGAYLEFEAKADGYLYVMFLASSDKAYTVFEEGTAISYTFAATGRANTDLGSVYEFTLPYEIDGVQWAVKNSVGWAEQEFLKINAPDKYAAHCGTDTNGNPTWDAISINGWGVIQFPVYDYCRYIVNANDSRIAAVGYVFSATDNVTISSNGVTIIGEGGNNPVLPKCAKPEISILDGKVKFNCTTEGVKFHYTISNPDVKSGVTSQEVSMTQKYSISVYATKDGYEDSEVTTAELVPSCELVRTGDTNGDGNITVTDVINLMDVILTTP